MKSIYSMLTDAMKNKSAEECTEIIERLKTQILEDYDLVIYSAAILLKKGARGIRDGEPDDAKMQALSLCADLLMAVAIKGENDEVWNNFAALSMWYLGYPSEAMQYAVRWLDLSDNCEDAIELIKDIQFDLSGGKMPLLYTEDEHGAVENYIIKNIGDIYTVFHEMYSPDLHVDICVIPPQRGFDYCALVTSGMGSYEMNMPEDLEEYELERAELIMCVPPEMVDPSDSDSWFIDIMRTVAHLPLERNSWLAHGHTVGAGQGNTIDSSMPYNAVILKGANEFNDEPLPKCYLPSGEVVNFYYLVPIYAEELDFKLSNGASKLFGLFRDSGVDPKEFYVVNDSRCNMCSPKVMREPWVKEYLRSHNIERVEIFDCAEWHTGKIPEKNLPVDVMSAYSHLAIYLRWCIEHDLMSDEFLQNLGDVAEDVKSGKNVDLRYVLKDSEYLSYRQGAIMFDCFNELGQQFTEYYYGRRSCPHFPADIDEYAENYFGKEKYYSDEFQDEAYLFVPFDEEYYSGMAKVIQKRWDTWRRNLLYDVPTEDTPLAAALRKYLDCECRFYPPMPDADKVLTAYRYAHKDSVIYHSGGEHYVPVLVAAHDPKLWEGLMFNCDCAVYDEYLFDEAQVENCRNEILDMPTNDSAIVLSAMVAVKSELLESDEKICGGKAVDFPDALYDIDAGMTRPVLLAKLPTVYAWDVFAYLSVGGKNCPDPADLRLAAREWFLKYGAAPMLFTGSEIYFTLPKPVPKRDALSAAKELAAVCPDLLKESTLGALADTLSKSTVWRLAWNN